jgi:hypothetical protein
MIRFLKNLFKTRPVFANAAEGVHPGLVTRTLESTVTTRHLIGKTGSTASQVAVCGAADSPLGVITDTGEAGDPVNVNLLSSTRTTALMIAAEAISVGEDVYTAAGGKVQDQPVVTGTYYQVGRALTAATGDGAVIEVEPCAPRKLIVAEAFTGVGNTDVITLAGILQQGPDKIVMLPDM